MRTFASAYYKGGEAAAPVGDALILVAYHLLGAALLGFLIGAICKALVSRPTFHNFSTIFVAIMACDGLAAYLGLSPLLINLFFGVYLANSTEVAEKQLTTLEPLEPMLYICFFTLAGASLHLSSLAEVGGLALVYFAAVLSEKGWGLRLAGLVGKCSKRIWQNMAFSLTPQAGVAIGLVILLDGDKAIPAELTRSVGAIVLAAVTINEMIGPFFTKAALVRSGEANRDRQRLVEFLAEEFIMVNLKARDKWDAIHQLVSFLMRTHRVEHISEKELYQTVVNRENEMSTAMGAGIALPHGRIEKGPAIQGVMGIFHEGIDFGSPDGEPVRLVMLIVTPKEHVKLHLKVLASLSSMVREENIRTRLMAASAPKTPWKS